MGWNAPTGKTLFFDEFDDLNLIQLLIIVIVQNKGLKSKSKHQNIKFKTNTYAITFKLNNTISNI